MIIVFSIDFSGNEANLSVFKDEDVEVGFCVHDDLFWMGNFHLYLLSEREKRLLHEVVEEEELLEDGLVGLLEVVSAEGERQL